MADSAQDSTRDSTQRFSNRVADYVKARPGYPAAILTTLRERIGLAPSWTVADIGAGTGISTRLFLDAGNTVIAVEPNAAMREAMAASLGTHDRLTIVNGTDEATSLAAGSIDLVVAAQAFHWFDRAKFRAECLRVLRPGGYVALIWNDRNAAGTPFLAGYERLLERFGTDYVSVNHRNIGDEGIAAFFAPAKMEVARIPSAQRFNFEGLQARLLSSSYAPPAEDVRSGPMLVALRELFDRTQENGEVEMTYETQVYFGKLQ